MGAGHVRQRDSGNRDAGMLAGTDDFGLEFIAVPSTPAPGDGLDDDGSVHVST